MQRLVAAAFGACAMLGIAAAAMPARQQELANAERAFAAAGLRDGVQKAFLAHFADEAIVLRPFATPARAWYERHPDRPGRLIWGPQYVAVSAAGDLGLSSGPWRFEGEQDGKPVTAHGHFFSIWSHDDKRGWQVAFDHGTSHAAGAVAVEDTPLVALTGTGNPQPPARADAQRRSLERADDALRARLAQAAQNAYAGVARADTLWLRDGLVPVRGAAPLAGHPESKHACGCGPRVKLAIAASGELGYTIGGSADARERGADVRVWRFEAGRGWSLLADVAVAVD